MQYVTALSQLSNFNQGGLSSLQKVSSISFSSPTIIGIAPHKDASYNLKQFKLIFMFKQQKQNDKNFYILSIEQYKLRVVRIFFYFC